MGNLQNKRIIGYFSILFAFVIIVFFGKTVSNARGLFSGLEVGDLIHEDGMMYTVISTNPRKAELTQVYDKSKKNVCITALVFGDDDNYYEVTAIQNFAFSGSKVKTVTIYGVKTIANYAFEDCKKLREVHIEDGVKTIGDGAFINCANLRTVWFGEDVKKIGKEAFYNCKKLKRINLDTQCLKSVGKNAFKKIDKNYKIYCDKKFKKKYQKLVKGKIGA